MHLARMTERLQMRVDTGSLCEVVVAGMAREFLVLLATVVWSGPEPSDLGLRFLTRFPFKFKGTVYRSCMPWGIYDNQEQLGKKCERLALRWSFSWQVMRSA